MKQLWAPWRFEYIQRKEELCIFCEKPKEGKDRDNLILHRGRSCFIIMNKFPYNNGHLMVAPYRHLVSLEELSSDEVIELFKMMEKSLRVLKKVLKPDGFNIGMNIGKASGAGFEHLHIHIVPRWVGDTNFMPVLAETKVISEHLLQVFDRLVKEFNESNFPKDF